MPRNFNRYRNLQQRIRQGQARVYQAMKADADQHQVNAQVHTVYPQPKGTTA